MSETGAADWRPSASLEVLRLRADLLARIRDWFAERGVWEVETPALSAAATTDPQIHSFATRYAGPGAGRAGRTLYLHTSPEFAMKRLLAAGSGSIYQVCKVFRAAEAGSRHNPEFTLVEWYRVGWDHLRLMEEVAALVAALVGPRCLLGPSERLTYREAFQRHAGIDPDQATVPEWRACAARHGIQFSAAEPAREAESWADLLLSQVVTPGLGQGRISFVHDFPAAQASLARVRPDTPPVAERFEAFLDGMELANGFHELTDPVEQRRRFVRDQQHRAAAGDLAIPTDERLLAALEAGLPACAGVALGFDRLVMVAAGVRRIAAVLAFPVDRA
ncbi:MAG: hypothetical protein B7Z66_00675 [Chromatiales bacterium 21-64-14]|nr:MAG: hypothetical protein B7Z66_00675 [Chromatiales bacterium 21-64-14]HQU15545.1 EF-P lysine aminoacylase EpmA [Gammaproteobacteria bacterium]